MFSFLFGHFMPNRFFFFQPTFLFGIVVCHPFFGGDAPGWSTCWASLFIGPLLCVMMFYEGFSLLYFPFPWCHSHHWPCFYCSSYFWTFCFSFGFCGAFGSTLQMHDLVAFWFVFWILSSCQFCCFLDNMKVLGIPFRSSFIFSFLHDTLDEDIPYRMLLKKDAQVTSMGFSFGVLPLNLPIYSIPSPLMIFST